MGRPSGSGPGLIFLWKQECGYAAAITAAVAVLGVVIANGVELEWRLNFDGTPVVFRDPGWR